MGVRDSDPLAQLSLPPGFRFYPTDEELMVQYLCKKIAGQNPPLKIIGDVDLYKFDPWELPSKAMFGEKEWYFFSPRDRKYPNGSRPNRVAGSGYWKATGTDKVINTDGRKVGIKKALVFYIGKAPKGTKTNWIMHEYRLSESTRKNGSTKLDEWVLCRIYKKNSNGSKPSCDGDPVMEHSYGSSSSCSTQYSDILEKLPEIDDKSFTLPRMNPLSTMHHQETDQKFSLSRLNSGIDWAALTGGISTLPDLGLPPSQTQFHSSIMNNNVPNQNELFMPNVHQIGQGRVADEEVQSRVVGTHQRVDNSGGYLFNSNAFTQSFAHSIDPFAITYPL